MHDHVRIGQDDRQNGVLLAPEEVLEVVDVGDLRGHEGLIRRRVNRRGLLLRGGSRQSKQTEERKQ